MRFCSTGSKRSIPFGRNSPDDVFVSTQLALTELLFSGCTTSSDHHYLWPNGSRSDDQFAAAETVGVRFHGARQHEPGREQGGLPPDRVTEDEEAILRDSRRVVETFMTPTCMRCVGCWPRAAHSA